jgi:tetratricopeptide (TPR) repeat protein
MVLLAKAPSDEPVRVFRVLRARKLFRQALEVLLKSVGDLHPLVAYAYDRMGFAQQEWGDLREAERLYLRAIAIRDIGGWVPTIWDELTFINLAILYGQQGRHALRDAMVERSRSAAAWVKETRPARWTCRTQRVRRGG